LAETCLQDVVTLLHTIEPLLGLHAKNTATTNNGHSSESDHEGTTNVIKIPKNSCGNLVSAAVSGWTLLLTVIGSEFSDRRVHTGMKSLQGLLEHAELEVKSGETLVVPCLFRKC